MTVAPLVIALPIADRRAALAFYRDGLGLEAFGPVADDGVPEPLQFTLAEGCHLMLIPTGGFGWVAAGHEVAAPGHSECVLTLTAGDEAEVQAVVTRARAAGATVRTEPGWKDWGYLGTFADPDGHLWMVVAQ